MVVEDVAEGVGDREDLPEGGGVKGSAFSWLSSFIQQGSALLTEARLEGRDTGQRRRWRICGEVEDSQ